MGRGARREPGRAIAAARHDDIELARLAPRLLEEVLASDDAREGVTAFAAKRAPRGKGR